MATAEMKLPIIFSPRYDIRVPGIEKLHPFDSEKYGKVHRYLVDTVGIDEGAFSLPDSATNEVLLKVHTSNYLESLNKSTNIALIAEVMMAALVPNGILQKHLLESIRYATGGTILGCRLAIERGWAINLSGGYHHAKTDSGGGFCFFADVPIAVTGPSIRGTTRRRATSGTTSRLGRDIPILMLLSGGYTRKSAGVIGRSIGNLLKHVIKMHADGNPIAPDESPRAGKHR